MTALNRFPACFLTPGLPFGTPEGAFLGKTPPPFGAGADLSAPGAALSGWGAEFPPGALPPAVWGAEFRRAGAELARSGYAPIPRGGAPFSASAAL